jgi:hypothetical protein
VYDSIFVESRGKPTITLVFQYFANDALSGASSHGMPQIRLVPENIVSECTIMEEIEPAIEKVIDNVVTGLTRPLTSEEASPEPKVAGTTQRIAFQGSLEEVQKFFYKRGWTDGLPVIPPTEEAVAEMLTGTDLAADYLVNKLEPRNGKATVERIAINAVMAGCLPTHMPVLIAGTRALVSNTTAVMMAASTGSFSPFWLINGPIRQDINVNCSYGAMNPGDIANAAIGRAMGLITKNIRGVRKQMEDMGLLGNPCKYTWVAGENEENSPWEPLHVERGFRKEDSTVTLTFPRTFQQITPYVQDDTGILKSICYNVAPLNMGIFAVLLTPSNAKILSSRGWSKKAVKEYIIRNAVTPRDHMSSYYSLPPAERAKLNSQDIVPIFQANPKEPSEPVQIYVVGGFGAHVGMVAGGRIATEKIELPAGWDKLVAKYKDMVPSYVRY